MWIRGHFKVQGAVKTIFAKSSVLHVDLPSLLVYFCVTWAICQITNLASSSFSSAARPGTILIRRWRYNAWSNRDQPTLLLHFDCSRREVPVISKWSEWAQVWGFRRGWRKSFTCNAKMLQCIGFKSSCQFLMPWLLTVRMAVKKQQKSGITWERINYCDY